MDGCRMGRFLLDRIVLERVLFVGRKLKSLFRFCVEAEG